MMTEKQEALLLFSIYPKERFDLQGVFDAVHVGVMRHPLNRCILLREYSRISISMDCGLVSLRMLYRQL